eukprot:scaffold106998_cov60-Phaeocystis_antarctica.AAC.4
MVHGTGQTAARRLRFRSPLSSMLHNGVGHALRPQLEENSPINPSNQGSSTCRAATNEAG